MNSLDSTTVLCIIVTGLCVITLGGVILDETIGKALREISTHLKGIREKLAEDDDEDDEGDDPASVEKPDPRDPYGIDPIRDPGDWWKHQ